MSNTKKRLGWRRRRLKPDGYHEKSPLKGLQMPGARGSPPFSTPGGKKGTQIAVNRVLIGLNTY